jgi:Asp-tRNA(Asn)/Glu-tRNA(Gln) amidotransferase B subunit
MRVLVPPEVLAAIIKRVMDGTISMASAKILFNHIYEQNLKAVADGWGL